jgi:hypothetical protein
MKKNIGLDLDVKNVKVDDLADSEDVELDTIPAKHSVLFPGKPNGRSAKIKQKPSKVKTEKKASCSWTEGENLKFIDAVREHGRNYKKISELFNSSRTYQQL